MRSEDASVPRASSWVRSVFWDELLRVLVGGVAVDGEVPRGAAVVVANHGSHADTAALIAALGRRHAVLVVAGGDYWTGWRGRLAKNVAGILPIAREGGFEELVAKAGEHLRAGGVVVLFPEGTRTRDGSVGRFRSGAARLAAEAQVPVVPAGLRGTRELFGKGRRLPDLAASRDNPLALLVGAPVLVTSQDDAGTISAGLRDDVARLLAEPLPAVDPSPAWEWAQTRLSGRRGAAFTFGWAFAEGLFFPIVAEAGILPVALAHGRRSVPAIAAAVAGSVAGVGANWALARAGVRVPWPMTTPSMHESAAKGLRRDVGQAFQEQRGNGIPVKVYARTAGQAGIPVWTLIPAAAAARASRIVPIGLGMAVVGEVAKRRLRVSYGAVLVGSVIGTAIGLELVVRRWKPHR
jgi:1-acyl-sn-glycerol-3-phosphate acyltransferase